MVSALEEHVKDYEVDVMNLQLATPLKLPRQKAVFTKYRLSPALS